MTTISKMKAFDDLTRDELKLVFENNSKLREKVFDAYFEDVNIFNEEYLSCWDDRAIDYIIGMEKGAFFVACDMKLFIKGLQKAQHNFGFLSQAYDELIAEADSLLNKLDEDLSKQEADETEAKLDIVIGKLEKACFKQFMDTYADCYDRSNQLDYFLDLYAEFYVNDNHYVDDNYILYEEVRYTKCYK